MIGSVPLTEVIAVLDGWEWTSGNTHTWQLGDQTLIMLGHPASPTFILINSNGKELQRFQGELRKGDETLRKQKTTNGFVGFDSRKITHAIQDGADSMTFVYL